MGNNKIDNLKYAESKKRRVMSWRDKRDGCIYCRCYLPAIYKGKFIRAIVVKKRSKK